MTLSLRSPLLSALGFRHGFSLRVGGVSEPPFSSLNLGRAVGDDAEAVAENHLRFAADVGYAPARLYEVHQVHGRAVETVDATVLPATYRAREADALVSCTPGCAVGIRVADCVPILLADPKSGAVSAVHAGWRGMVDGVVEAAVATLAQRAATPRSALVAAVFPCIGAEAFEVGDDVAEAIVRAVASPTVRRDDAGRARIDLALAARLQLARAGLVASAIDHVAGCTFTEPQRFFSHRRDHGRTGRHLAAIVPRC